MPEPVAPGRPLDASNLPWFAAPATSHIWGWKFFDARVYANTADLTSLGPVSLLLVRFRDKAGAPGDAYFYGFSDAAAGQAISDAMEDSDHPYSAVFYPRVRKAGIPYAKA
jgi:hypothetical protein